MGFTPNIPANGQTLGSSRLQVLNNFSSLRTTISNASLPNHIDVNLTGAGKHIFVELPVQTPSPANQPAASEGGLITQTASGSSELFYARDNEQSGGNPVYRQITGPVTVAQQGSSVLFGGLIIKWGRVAGATSGSVITFPGGAFPNNVYNLLLTTKSTLSGKFVGYSALSTTSFTPNFSPSTDDLNYIAIGN